jgi:AraC-like DNA-binding protein
MFHIVTTGECRLEFEDARGGGPPARRVRVDAARRGPRDQARRGRPHRSTIFDLPIERVSPRYEVLTHGGGGADTTLICGAVRIEHPAACDLVALLPSLIHIKTWDTPNAEWMHSTLRLMAAEASSRQPGGETIVTRLADILVIQAIRSWLVEHPESRRGWLGALTDARVGPALLLIHREPSKDWTVASLAESVSMSRSAFSARFTDLVGESAMQYVTRWRMHVAGAWLRDTDMTAAECGAKLGYNSEAAFNRAFKRVVGMTPGAWQSRKRESPCSTRPLASNRGGEIRTPDLLTPSQAR